jgi:HlyD family secretion protein
LLAVLEPRTPEFLDARERQRAEAQLAAARAGADRAASAAERAVLAHDHATSETERLRRLAAADAASREELDAAEQAARIAAEDVRAARHGERVAQYEAALAEAALVFATAPEGSAAAAKPLEIRSPADGAVLRVLQESETVVAGGTPLLEVGDPSDLEVVVEVLSRDAVRIAPGASAELVRWGGAEPLAGRVRRVEPAAFTKVSALGIEEQRVLVIVDLAGPPDRWSRLGDAYRVEARILVDEVRDALVVPAGALFRTGADWTVFRFAAGTVELRIVAAGRTDGLVTEIVSGLEAGDSVVLHPGENVVPGARAARRARTPR